MFSRCRVCGRPLKSKKSATKGIGPGCEKKLMYEEAKMEEIKAARIEEQKDEVNFIDELKEEVMTRKCDKCGKSIRFIKRRSAKALVVNYNPIFFIPDLSGEMYVISGGIMRRGRVAPDGLKGFTIHNC